MRRHLYLTAIALTLGASVGVYAQGGGSGFGGGSSGGAGGGGNSFSGGSSMGGGGTSLGGGGSSFSGSSSGGNSFSGGSSSGGSSSGGTSFSGSTGFGGGSGAGGGAAGGRGAGGGTSGFTVSPTNQFGITYSNPLAYSKGTKITAMGNAANPMQGVGFGQPSLGAVSAARTSTTTSGRAGSATVNRGSGMSGGLGSGQNNMPAISYATTMRFPTPPVIPQALRANLQNVVFRSSAISVPGNVRVETDGTTIVLRGKVVDEDERRLIEGMVRLEPGVQDVRNELQVGP